MTNFNVSIVSDTVCSWCYIGKNKLDRAISTHKTRHPSDTFTITWHPYYLDPSAPKVGVDKRQMFAAKFGPQRSAMIDERVSSIGKEVGIDFRTGGKIGSTRDSHRLIHLAGTRGDNGKTQTRVVEGLFRKYFEEERDITSHEVLREAAVEAGIDDKEARKWLESDEGGAVVDEEVRTAQMKGISGVPNYTLQGQLEIGGAQDQEAFLRAFQEVKAVEG